MPLMNWINTPCLPHLAGLVLVALITACSSTIPALQEERTLRHIYDNHTAKDAGTRSPVKRPSEQVTSSPTALSDYTRSVHNATDALFPILPNPTLFLYISPHRAGREGFPIPGYTIAVTLFERTHYASPGERTDEH